MKKSVVAALLLVTILVSFSFAGDVLTPGMSGPSPRNGDVLTPGATGPGTYNGDVLTPGIDGSPWNWIRQTLIYWMRIF